MRKSGAHQHSGVADEAGNRRLLALVPGERLGTRTLLLRRHQPVDPAGLHSTNRPLEPRSGRAVPGECRYEPVLARSYRWVPRKTQELQPYG
jgi:hypothetical protein